MKKPVYYLLVLLFIIFLVYLIYALFARGDDYIPKEDMVLPREDISSQATTDNTSGIQNHVRRTGITGYIMLAQSDDICVYEIYENGYREKIKVLDIDIGHLREFDRNLLREGIIVENYEEICGLIEDFSS